MASSTDERWIERRTADGSSTLAHAAHGETYHSTSGAWTQARERYARECRLGERAREIASEGARERGRVLHLLDIGTGLGLNLAAALEAVEGTGVALAATTCELDEALLAHVVSSPRAPADLEIRHAPVRAALAAALASRTAESVALDGGGTLRLLLGDARAMVAKLPLEPRFDAVFLDPFSQRVEPGLWEPEFLREVARRMAPGSILSTYSAATAVRAGLFASGLRIGRGARVGGKREGTLAGPDRDLPPLDARVLRRIAARAAASTVTPHIRPPVLPESALGFASRAGDPRAAMS